MAELILSALSLGLAAPGIVVAFVEAGDYIQKKVRSFKNAPKEVREIGIFGHDLHVGKLKLNIELAVWAYSLSDLDITIKDAIEDHINKLKMLICESDYRLNQMFDSSGEVKRFYFTIIGERKAQTLVKSLREWQNDFSNAMALIEMKQRVLPNSSKLSRDKFALKGFTRLSPNSDISIGQAEKVEDGVTREVQVLIERMPMSDTTMDAEAEEVASTLARHLHEIPSGGGILNCLGFRKTEHAELIFELPSPHCELQTLRDVIAASQGAPYGGGHPLDERFRLARQLCNAILSVFYCGLVHKSIRTDAIILLSASGTTQGLGTPFLTSWTMLRKATGLTSGPSEGDYMKDFYRHPKRQGLQPEERYNMGHDVYSLGVCLLEISLWEPFFGSDGFPSPRFRDAAVRLGYVSADHSGALDVWAKPMLVANVLRVLAEQEVPQRMGTTFSHLIVSCLTCLEGGMGEPSYFRNETSVAAVRFNEIVSQSFKMGGT